MTRTRWWPAAILLAGIIVFLALSIDGLRVFPAVGEDEPWIAAAPARLATEGVYGSRLFEGYFGVDRHNYQHPPVYPLLQAAVFRAFGVGVLQMRLLPVAFGAALLIAVFLVGRQAADARVGAAAVGLMIGLRIADGGAETGILLLDRARINRYDIAVPVFGLLALWLFNRAREQPRAWRWAATGMLCGLASLSHLFGGFWLVVLVLAILSQRDGITRARALRSLGAGFCATWLPWIGYIALGWSDFVGQMRFVSSRFNLFDVDFYTRNLLYADGPLSVDWLMRVGGELPWTRAGSWVVLVGTPVAALFIAVRARGGPAQASRVLALAAIAQLVLFAVLLEVKTINYMIGLWPLGALLLAWLGIRLWDHRGTPRVVAVVVLALVLAEGGTRIAHARDSAAHATPYEWFTGEVARCIPPGSLVLGLQHYWLGLRQFPYRTWLVATNLAHPAYSESPVGLDEAIARIDPDVILIDRYMARFFEAAAAPGHPYHRWHAEYTAFVARRRVEPVCIVRDRTYGEMEVLRVPPTTR